MKVVGLAAFVLLAGCSNTSATPDAGDAGLQIVLASPMPSRITEGSALPLKVVVTASDGTTQDLPAGTNVTWTLPETVAAADPLDAGSAALPAEAPLGFFISNPFRPDRTDYDGTLFVVQQGASTSPNLVVTATVENMGVVTTQVAVYPVPVGDSVNGAALYQALQCGSCHGATGAGSPPQDDGTYLFGDASYPYPAEGLNSASTDAGPNLGANPSWNAALLALASQGSIDNSGVALRVPMPDYLGAPNGLDGGTLTSQDFADIYAFLLTEP
jgi:hypothetical protein